MADPFHSSVEEADLPLPKIRREKRTGRISCAPCERSNFFFSVTIRLILVTFGVTLKHPPRAG